MGQESAIERAIRIAGGVAALGRQLEESTQTVSNWRQRGEAPANKCAAIERITGISRKELRTDWRDYWPELGDRRHEHDLALKIPAEVDRRADLKAKKLAARGE
jgi:DNA-binding transcriptional regulator YdaS (Cro superfamily)